jgi:hypothetical protein
MAMERASFGEMGRDPVHLTLQKHWYINVAWYLGINGVDYVEEFRDMDPNFLPRNDGYTANLMFRMLNYQVALLTSGQPDFSVLPNTGDIDDLIGSRVAQHFLAHYDNILNFRGMRREEAEWLVTCGNAFKFADWDAMAGAKLSTVRNPYSDEVMSQPTDEQRELAAKAGTIDERREGKLTGDILSPFQVLIPRRTRKFREANWCVLEYERSIDWIWDHYPKEAKKISPSELDTAADGQYWQRLQTLVQRTGYTLPGQGGTENGDNIRIIELWYPPSGQYPKGLWVRTTKNTVLAHGPHPYADAGIDLDRNPHMRIPVVHSKYASAPGRPWGQSLAEHLVGPQNDYNRARHQLNEQAERLGHPQWMAPSGTTFESTSDEYGEIFTYSGGSSFREPTLINPPAISGPQADRANRNLGDMRLISAQGEAIQGEVPTGMRSGAALRALQEKDNMTISPVIQELEESWEEYGRKILTLTQHFMDIPRAIQVYGEFRAPDVEVYKGNLINDNVFVTVRRGSMMPKSKAEAMSSIMDLVQAGLINPQDQRHLRMAYKRMEFEGANSLFYEEALDERNADHENLKFLRPRMVNGQLEPYPMPKPSDDDEAHLRKHDEFEKSPAFDRMPLDAKLAFLAHKQKHQEAIQDALMAMAAQQQAMMPPEMGAQGSAPRQPGQASQPAQRQPTPGTESGST